MAAKMEKTSEPGLYKRGARYVFSVRVSGVQKWYSFRTFTEARRAKRAFSAQIDAGEFQERSRITLHEYMLGNEAADGWIDTYLNIRPETRSEYRGIIAKYYFQPDGFFSSRLKIGELDPKMVRGFVEYLAKQPGRRSATLSDNTVRNILSPLRAAMATARQDTLVRTNPVDRVRLPRTARIEEDHERARAFPPGAMEMVVDLIAPKYRLMFELLAVTGLRRSELLALEGHHLALNGDRPCVKVRQRVRRQKGAGLVIGPVKSKYSRRDVPIGLDIADKLRALRVADDALIFCTRNGTPHDGDNLASRVLGPQCSEAGVEWAGFHTFRHTVASLLFASGRNIVQVQRFLGHHSPAFTLETYVHLLEDSGIGGPLVLDGSATTTTLDAELGALLGANAVRTEEAPLHDIAV
jgi:integrase